MRRHAEDCVCGLCLTYQLRLRGAELSLREGRIVAYWGDAPPAMRELARTRRAAIVALLGAEASLEATAGTPRRAQMLAICARSSRPECRDLADAIRARSDDGRILQLGLRAADAIRFGDAPLAGKTLDGFVKEVFE